MDIRSRKLLKLVACSTMLFALALPSTAQAKSHLWDILTVYSNAEGNVQFIDLFVSDPAGTGEYFVGSKSLYSNANTYPFPKNLPQDHTTFLTWVLVATQDYADLPGAPTPDYIMPPNFFDPAGDEIRYGSTEDIFTIPPGAMPTDGILMLNRDLTTSLNLGINFDDESGTVTHFIVHLPEVPSLGSWGVGAATLVSAAVGASVLLGRRRTTRTT